MINILDKKLSYFYDRVIELFKWLAPRPPWRGRFTLLPILAVIDRVIGVCQQSERRYGVFFYVCDSGLTNLFE